jgi:molecular chaperone DnaK (HSP70)
MAVWSVGIDLGCSNTCVAVQRSGLDKPPEIVLSAIGERLTPSMVAFTPTEVLVGGPAAQQRSTNPLNTFYEFKRVIGRSYGERELWRDARHWPFKLLPPDRGEGDAPRYCAVHHGRIHRLTALDLSTVLLQTAAAAAQARLAPGDRVARVAIAVPAHFPHRPRAQTIEAGARAFGDNVAVSVINEPTAAIMSHAPPEHPETVLVFDLGAGTLDVTVVHRDPAAVHTVLGSHGSAEVGGGRMDQRLLELVATHHREHTEQDLRALPRRLAAVRDRCEAAKRTLSVVQTVDIEVAEDVPPCRVTRAAYEAAIEPELTLADAVIGEALAAAEHTVAAIDRVVLCGGASRTPAVQRRVAAHFEATAIPVVVDPCPDEVVAIGACVAHPVAEPDDPTHTSPPPPAVTEVLAHTVGIRTGFDTMHAMVPRGSALPATVAVELVAADTLSHIEVFEGDHTESASTNTHVGTVSMTGDVAVGDPLQLQITLSADNLVGVQIYNGRTHETVAGQVAR